MGLLERIAEKEKKGFAGKKDSDGPENTGKGDVGKESTGEENAGKFGIAERNIGAKTLKLEGYGTEVDNLYSLVRRKKRILLRDAAKELGVSVADAEDWAGMLSRHKLIVMHYPPFGRAELRSLDYRPSGGFLQKVFHISRIKPNKN